MILVVRTDGVQAYCGLYNDDGIALVDKNWLAGRELSQQIIAVIEELFVNQSSTFIDMKGIVFYRGPGSYTGLRIGASVVNALGYSCSVQVVGTNDEGWIQVGIQQLREYKSFLPLTIEYGGNARVTQPKK